MSNYGYMHKRGENKTILLLNMRWMEEILHQLISGYPIIYRVSTIQGDAGFLPTTVGILKYPYH